jgi:hypothetical protein
MMLINNDKRCEQDFTEYELSKLVADPLYYVQINKNEDSIYEDEYIITVVKILNESKVHPGLVDIMRQHFDYGCPVDNMQEGMWLIEAKLIDDSGWTDIGFEYSSYVDFLRAFRLQSVDPILDYRL